MSNTSYTNKLHPGSEFPELNAKDLSGNLIPLGSANKRGTDWQLVVVYRGQHCPLCTKYLNQLESYVDDLANIGVDVVAVSGDSESQLRSHMERLNVSFPITYGLTQNQMQTLGLYVSEPRSEQETDHNFAEPGLFVVNEHGNVHVVDISNNPFVRPELQALVNGLGWIGDPSNNYPIRGLAKYD